MMSLLLLFKNYFLYVGSEFMKKNDSCVNELEQKFLIGIKSDYKTMIYAIFSSDCVNLKKKKS